MTHPKPILHCPEQVTVTFTHCPKPSHTWYGGQVRCGHCGAVLKPCLLCRDGIA